MENIVSPSCDNFTLQVTVLFFFFPSQGRRLRKLQWFRVHTGKMAELEIIPLKG